MLPAASALGVPARIRAEVTALGRPVLVRELDLALDILGSRLVNVALAGRPAAFADLPHAAREAYLKHWAASPLGVKRKAFQVLKRLTLLYTYGQEGSPYWTVAGYERPPLALAARPAAIRARVPRAGERIEADACVIGSGAGGAVVAATLAAAGKRVVVLERARLRTEEDFDGRELAGYAALFLDRGIAATEDRAIVILAGSAVGGGTVVNWNTSLRLPPGVREEWRAAGIVDDLDRHYDAVEARLDVNADESARNGPNMVFERGLRALGIPHDTIRRNARGCGDCGHCTFGCRLGAKRSTLRTYLDDASRGGAEVLHGSDVRRVLLKDGRVQGVVAQVTGGEVTIAAPIVALAGGSILSPAVLLRSGIAAEQAGRGLALHPFTVVFGAYDDDVVTWRGVPQSVVTHSFAGANGAGGFRIEAGPALPGLIAAAVPWWGAAGHLALMRESCRLAPFGGFARDTGAGRVEIDRAGDPRVRYSLAASDRATLVQAQIEMARIHRAAGARQVVTLHTPPLVLGQDDPPARFERELARRGVEPNRAAVFSAHQMASCRIGTDPRASVADPDGQVWGARGLFVTDASAFPSASGVNPMLTVMALARRIAERMV